jgi:hypothetical protein
MTHDGMAEDTNDPRHVYQARAAHVARQAERDFDRSIGLAPENQHARQFANLRALLRGDEDQTSEATR